MDKNATIVLAELRQDHQNMTLMLKLLERESNLIYADGDPDFELLADVMHYMTVYSDAVHHPKEDRLYAELKVVRPELSNGFERISVDHRHIAKLGVALRDEILHINSGAFVRRNTVVANALRYVNTLRGHMQWEDLDLFRRVEEMINEGHQFIDAANFSQELDPVFGPEVEQRFARLVTNIQETAG